MESLYLCKVLFNSTNMKSFWIFYNLTKKVNFSKIRIDMPFKNLI